MARNEDVNTVFWEDEDVDALSDDAAFLYLWSFTNERCNMAGLYQCKARHVLEGRLTPARREAAIQELSEARFLFYVDGWIWVRSRVKNLNTKGEKMARSVVKMVDRVPADHPLRAAFLTEYLENHWISSWLAEADFDTPSIPHLQPIDGLQGQGRGRGRGKGEKNHKTSGPDPDSFPADFDPKFSPVLQAVQPILHGVAVAKGAQPVQRLPLAKTLMAYPDRDHVAVARELDYWLTHGNGKNRNAKDVVATYRNFLKRADAVAQPIPRLQAVPDPYDAMTEQVNV